jgi:hypothetical protein
MIDGGNLMNKVVRVISATIMALIAFSVINGFFGIFSLDITKSPADVSVKTPNELKPWIVVRESDPMKTIGRKGTLEAELVRAESLFERINDKGIANAGSSEIEIAALADSFKARFENRYEREPWLEFYESELRLLAADRASFEKITKRLHARSLAGDQLAFMGLKLDRLGFYEDGWKYLVFSLGRYMSEGDSLDDTNVLIFNQLFFPLVDMRYIAWKKDQSALDRRWNEFVKLNPKIEGVYWAYTQLISRAAQLSDDATKENLKKLAQSVYNSPLAFSASDIVHADLMANLFAVFAIAMLLYIALIRFKYRNRRKVEDDGDKRNVIMRFLDIRRSPYYYMKPSEYLFGVFLGALLFCAMFELSLDISSLGRTATLSLNFSLAKYGKADSLETLERFEKAYGEDPVFMKFYAHALAKSGKFEKARTLLETLLAKAPDDTSLLVNLACVQYSTGNRARSIELLTRALVLSPELLEARYDLALVKGEKAKYPAWFEELLDSKELGKTVSLVAEHSNELRTELAVAALSNLSLANGSALGEGSTLVKDSYSAIGSTAPVMISDGGVFLKKWANERFTLRGRLNSLIAVLSADSVSRFLSFFSMTIRGVEGKSADESLGIMSLVQILAYLVLGTISLVAFKANGSSASAVLNASYVSNAAEGEQAPNSELALDGDRDFGDDDFLAPRADSDSDGGSAAKISAATTRVAETPVAKMPAARFGWIATLVSFVPFLNNFAKGQMATGVTLLSVFGFSYLVHSFLDTSFWGIDGATGIFSAIAVPNIRVTLDPMKLIYHFANSLSTALFAAMVLSIVLSYVARFAGRAKNAC